MRTFWTWSFQQYRNVRHSLDLELGLDPNDSDREDADNDDEVAPEDTSRRHPGRNRPRSVSSPVPYEARGASHRRTHAVDMPVRDVPAMTAIRRRLSAPSPATTHVAPVTVVRRSSISAQTMQLENHTPGPTPGSLVRIGSNEEIVVSAEQQKVLREQRELIEREQQMDSAAQESKRSTRRPSPTEDEGLYRLNKHVIAAAQQLSPEAAEQLTPILEAQNQEIMDRIHAPKGTKDKRQDSKFDDQQGAKLAVVGSSRESEQAVTAPKVPPRPRRRKSVLAPLTPLKKIEDEDES